MLVPPLTGPAALCFVALMTGAVVLTLAVGGGALAVLPAVVGVLAAVVAARRGGPSTDRKDQLSCSAVPSDQTTASGSIIDPVAPAILTGSATNRKVVDASAAELFEVQALHQVDAPFDQQPGVHRLRVGRSSRVGRRLHLEGLGVAAHRDHSRSQQLGGRQVRPG